MTEAPPPRTPALDSTRRSLPIALLRARETVMDHFRPMLHRHGLTEQQWRVIRVLNEAPGIDMGALAKAANILAPSLSRMTRTMQDRGWIAITRTTGDARRASLRLTPDGTDLIRAIAPESAAIRDRIESRIGAARLAALLDELEAIQRDLDGESPDEQPSHRQT